MSTQAAKLAAVPQSKSPSLQADFSWMFVGNAVYAAGQFLILMVLAKLVRPELVGQYALGLAIVYPVMMFTNMQLRSVITSGSRERVHFGHFLTLRLLSTAAGLATVFVVTRAMHYGRELTLVILMVGFAYSIETISDVYYARLQLHDRMAEIAKSLMARAILSVIGIGVVTYVTRSVFWGLAGVLFARALVLVRYDISERTQGLGSRSAWFSPNEALRPKFNLKTQAELAWLSVPLGVVVLLGCLNASVPNFFIKQALGERDLGIFAAIGFVVSVGNMAVVSLGQSAFTRLARSYKAADFDAFRSLLCKLLLFGAFIGVSGMIVSKFAGRAILTVLFRSEYAERADLLPWIMVAGGVLYMAQFVGFGLTAANCYKPQVWLNVIANVALFAACYLFVARQGLLGAILAMLIGASVQLAGSIVVLMLGMRKRTGQLAHTSLDRRTERLNVSRPSETRAAFTIAD
jgi:O-antigen/teichoic acid export membrane protein